jgi:hypothetical protein
MRTANVREYKKGGRQWTRLRQACGAAGYEYKEEPQMNANADRSKTKESGRDELPLIRRSTCGMVSIVSSGRAGARPYRGACELFRSSVRELRQRRAYYRCCIPALAGFVSHRSIAPDGFRITRLDDTPEQRLSRTWYSELPKIPLRG